MGKLTESKILEFKQDFTPSFLKTVSAYANYTDGKIIFGIKDNGQVIGIQDTDIFKLRVENSINDNIRPRPSFEISVSIIEDKEVVVLSVNKGMQTPYYYQHQVYNRSDTSTVAVDLAALQELILLGTNLTYEDLPVIEQNLKFHILENSLRKEIGIESFNHDILRSLGLYKNGKFNRAAELLADRNNIKQSSIDIARMGETNSIFLDRKTISEKSLLFQYEETLSFFDNWYKPYEEVSGFYREKRIQIPREAFREALANAIIHRNFSINAAIRIAMYQDRVEITSPGKLPTGISPEEFKMGRISVPRNAIIAEVFHRLNIIEKFATGIRRIIEEYKEFKEEPIFEIYENTITIILPCITYGNTERILNLEDIILNNLKENEYLTRKDIQQLTSLKDTKIKEVLKELIEEGKIVKVGKARATKYCIPDE